MFTKDLKKFFLSKRRFLAIGKQLFICLLIYINLVDRVESSELIIAQGGQSTLTELVERARAAKDGYAAIAIRYYTEAIQKSPNTPFLYLERAIVWNEGITGLGQNIGSYNDRRQKALQDVSKAIQLDKRYDDAYAYRCELYSSLITVDPNKAYAAINDGETALNINSNNVKAKECLKGVYLLLNLLRSLENPSNPAYRCYMTVPWCTNPGIDCPPPRRICD